MLTETQRHVVIAVLLLIIVGAVCYLIRDLTK
jgi:hypothetical protein